MSADEDRIRALYAAEKAAYRHYIAEQRGDLRRVILPSKVRAAKEEWEQAVSALRAAGGTPDAIRDLLAGTS